MVKDGLKGAGEGSLVLVLVDQLLAGGQLLASTLGFLVVQSDTLLAILGVASSRLAPNLDWISDSMINNAIVVVALVLISYRIATLIEAYQERRADDA